MGSDELARNLGKYKAYFKVEGDSFELIESFGDLGKITNVLKLNQNVPFYVPGEDITGFISSIVRWSLYGVYSDYFCRPFWNFQANELKIQI